MKRRNLIQGAMAIPLVGMLPPVWAGKAGKDVAPMAFAFGGSKKMLYDVRQRPQAVMWNGKVYIGYKGGGTEPLALLQSETRKHVRIAKRKCPRAAMGTEPEGLHEKRRQKGRKREARAEHDSQGDGADEDSLGHSRARSMRPASPRFRKTHAGSFKSQ